MMGERKRTEKMHIFSVLLSVILIPRCISCQEDRRKPPGTTRAHTIEEETQDEDEETREKKMNTKKK